MIIARYVYNDTRGRPRLKKLRFTDKRFMMRSALVQDSRGIWRYGDGITDEQYGFWVRSMYMLPDLVAAAPTIARALAPGGAAALAGLLVDQAAPAAAAYRATGLVEVADRRTEEDWVALTVGWGQGATISSTDSTADTGTGA